MINSELGQRRWRALLKPKSWLKIAEMITALGVIILCATFNQTAIIHMKHSAKYYRIFLKFPFIYKDKETVETPPDLTLSQFKFEDTLMPSAIVFFAVVAIASLLAGAIFCLHIFQRGSHVEQPFIRWDFFVALAVTFLLAAATGFWLSSVVRLKNNISDQVEFLLDKCDGNCVDSLPNYIQLYLSSALAIVLVLLWLADCVLIYITMVHTIPQQISQVTLVRNVELTSVQQE